MDMDTSKTDSAQPAQQNALSISNVTLFNMARDMRFMGIAYIILGGLYCLSIFGTLIGIPWLISGIRLRDSGDSFNYYADSRNINQLQNAIEQQSRFFRIQKILIIVMIVLVVVAFAVGIMFGLFFTRHLYSYQS